MHHWKIKLILGIFFSFLFCNAIAHSIQLTSLQVSSHKKTWRFVFNASGRIEFRSSILRNPLRLAVDFNQERALRFFNPDKYAESPVRSIHWENISPRRIRMILTLKNPVKYKLYALTPTQEKGYRFVIELSTLSKLAQLSPPKKLKKTVRKLAQQNNSNDTDDNEKETTAPLKATPALRRNSPIVVVIDAGHGGKDPGTTGLGGTHEKDVVLKISQRLYQMINQQPGFKAVLTRDSDYYLTLRQRLAIARKYQANMFVAIHADAAYRDSYAAGASVYALSLRGATGEAARWLAARENASELMGGVNLSDTDQMLKSVLINLSQTATIQSSLTIGYRILGALSRITQLHYHRIEQAAFVVLKSPDIPSLLIETGFLSNPREEKRLKNSAYQQELSLAIMQGIKSYFKQQG